MRKRAVAIAFAGTAPKWLALLWCLIGLLGCARGAERRVVESGDLDPLGRRMSDPADEALAIPSESIARYELAPGTPALFERFEYARNDRRVNARSAEPLLATRQWPEAPRPWERRVIFWYWRQ